MGSVGLCGLKVDAVLWIEICFKGLWSTFQHLLYETKLWGCYLESPL